MKRKKVVLTQNMRINHYVEINENYSCLTSIICCKIWVLNLISSPPPKKKSIISNFPNFLVVRTILRRVSQNFLIIHLWLEQPARVWNFGLGMSFTPLGTYRDTAPLAPHAGHTLGRPTGLLTGHTLGVGWQVPLPPVVVLHNILLL